MNRLAEMLDNKVRERAKQDFAFAELHMRVTQNHLRDADLLNAVRMTVEHWSAGRHSANKAIKMIKLAIKANNRFHATGTKVRSQARKAGLLR